MSKHPVLDLWGNPTTANVQKVTWFLRELALPWNDRGVDYQGGSPRDELYFKARVGTASPVLKDGEFVLWEGNAIVRYLAQSYGDASFYPADLKRRGDVDRWMDYQISTIRQPLHTLLRDDAQASTVARCADQLARMMEPVEATVAGQTYLAGDTFTIGDIPVGIAAYRWQLLDIPRPASPAIDAWLGRLRARPAFAAAICPPANTKVALNV